MQPVATCTESDCALRMSACYNHSLAIAAVIVFAVHSRFAALFLTCMKKIAGSDAPVSLIQTPPRAAGLVETPAQTVC